MSFKYTEVCPNVKFLERCTTVLLRSAPKMPCPKVADLCYTVSAQEITMDAAENQIVVYQPNETVRLDVRLENKTVWLTQGQIANLFGTKRPAVTKHLANTYKSGELEREGTCSILEHMGNNGMQLYADDKAFNAQCPKLAVCYNESFHNRFLFIDDKERYLLGASLKDLGRKCFVFTNLDTGDIRRIKKSAFVAGTDVSSKDSL